MKKLSVIIGILALLASCQPQGGIVFNEITGKDADGDEWIEVGNNSATDINVADYKIVKYDKDGIDKTIYTFPDTVIKAGAVYVINESDLRLKGKKNGIPCKKAVSLELLDANGNVLDAFDSKENLSLKGHPVGSSYARIPNLTGEWTLCGTPTFDAPNVNNAAVEVQPEHEASEFDDEEDELDE